LGLFATAAAPKVAVFDLDSTLFDNRPRQAQILREYGIIRGLPELFHAERQHFLDWDLLGPLVRIGIEQKRAEAIFPDLKEFWRSLFFTSPYCLFDVALPGAPQFVRKLHELGATIVYLTGRHEEMRAGSAESLRRFAFPVPDRDVRTHLMMKPTIEMPDTDYKVSAYAAIRKIGTVVAGFDNEPAHANALKQGFPEASVVWLRTDRSPALDEPREDLMRAFGFMGIE
jgi:hypothetical protein